MPTSGLVPRTCMNACSYCRSTATARPLEPLTAPGRRSWDRSGHPGCGGRTGFAVRYVVMSGLNRSTRVLSVAVYGVGGQVHGHAVGVGFSIVLAIQIRNGP